MMSRDAISRVNMVPFRRQAWFICGRETGSRSRSTDWASFAIQSPPTRPSVRVGHQQIGPQPDSAYRNPGSQAVWRPFWPPHHGSASLIMQRNRMPAKFTGRHAHVLSEETCEVAVFFESQLFGHIGKRFVASPKQLDCMRHTDPIDIVLR